MRWSSSHFSCISLSFFGVGGWRRVPLLGESGLVVHRRCGVFFCRVWKRVLVVLVVLVLVHAMAGGMLPLFVHAMVGGRVLWQNKPRPSIAGLPIAISVRVSFAKNTLPAELTHLGCP
jgi:hypothetical protein